jgi:predicted ABC-type transport system involved in lysophospholipase L1 biosynthesis ATPase subunit
MLEARNVRKTYRTGAGALTVLDGVSLAVEPGASVAVTGPSGAGKSTLLHLLAGLDVPTAGEVLWQGTSLARMGERERAAYRNRTIGIVFQFYHLMPELSAAENVMLPGLVGGRGPARALRERAAAALARVGLRDRAGHRPSQLSGGEQQRAAIARALVNEPSVLLCDEPTGNLDSKTGGEIADLLFGLPHGRRMSLVLVTHEAALAARAQRRVHLQDGRVAQEAEKERR